MKRKVNSLLVIVITGILLLSSFEVFANTIPNNVSTNIEASNNLKYTGEIKTVPDHMLPGTILIYDDKLEPIVIQGGYTNIKPVAKTADKPYLAKIPKGATEKEIKQIELENEIAEQAFNWYSEGNYVKAPAPKIYPGMKVVYDELTGDLNNIYYVDENEPSGYSIHNVPDTEPSSKPSIGIQAANYYFPPWGAHNNTLVFQTDDDSFLGTGRATYYTGTTGNRDNTLKNYDCATHINYDYSKRGDKDLTIRNLNTNKAFSFYQADVGGLPDAIIDIWGLSNLHTLAGKTGVTSVDNVRYYHKRFSDQSVPR